MSEQDYIQNTYNALKAKVDGFNKTPEQYRDLMLNNPEYRANVHKALTAKVEGFSRTPEEFDSLVGVKKKEPSVPASDNPNIPTVTIPGESLSPDGTLSLQNRSVNTEPQIELPTPPRTDAPQATQVQPPQYTKTNEINSGVKPVSQELFHTKLNSTLSDLKSELKSTGYEPVIITGKRSIEDQQKALKQGLSQSPIGQHQYDNAIDIGFKKNGVIVKNAPVELYQKAGNIAKKYGLYWGGDWNKFKDIGHIQMYADAVDSFSSNPERVNDYLSNLDYYKNLHQKQLSNGEDDPKLKRLIQYLDQYKNSQAAQVQPGVVDKEVEKPVQPPSPEQINLNYQKAVLDPKVATNMIDLARETNDKNQLYQEAHKMALANRPAAAHAIADIILQKYPNDPYAHQLKAYKSELDKDYVNATQEITKAIETAPGDDNLIAKRAELAAKAGLTDTAKEDANEYIRRVQTSGNDMTKAVNLQRMYGFTGDEQKSKYWGHVVDGLEFDRQRNIDSQNLQLLADWMTDKFVQATAPVTAPAQMVIGGGEKVVEGFKHGSVPKIASGIISAYFGALGATPAGAIFNSAIASADYVGAGEVTQWAMAPISKLNELAGVDESKFTDTGQLITEVANFIPMMLFMHGYNATANKFTNREPMNGEDLSNIDQSIASMTPEKVQQGNANIETFKQNQQDIADVKAVQENINDTPTYRIDDKFYTKDEFVKTLREKANRARQTGRRSKIDYTVKGDEQVNSEADNLISTLTGMKEETVTAQSKQPQPIRQLGTGANVYYETPAYRVNDMSDGKTILNINDNTGSGNTIANIPFDSPAEAVKIATKLSELYPDGVPDAVLIDKVVSELRTDINKYDKTVQGEPEIIPEPQPLNPTQDEKIQAKGQGEQVLTQPAEPQPEVLPTKQPPVATEPVKTPDVKTEPVKTTGEKPLEQPQYEIRKSGNGYAVDKKEYGSWTFDRKFSTKKQAQDYINSKQPTPTEPVTPGEVKAKAQEAKNPNVPMKEQKKDLLGQIDEAIDIIVGENKEDYNKLLNEQKANTKNRFSVIGNFITDETIAKLKEKGFDVKEQDVYEVNIIKEYGKGPQSKKVPTGDKTHVITFDVEGDGTFTLNLYGLDESRVIVEKNFPTNEKPPANKIDSSGKYSISGASKFNNAPEENAANYWEAMRTGNLKLAEVFKKAYGGIPPEPKEGVEGIKADYYIIKPETKKYIPVAGAKAVKLAVPGDYFIVKDGKEYKISEAKTGLNVMPPEVYAKSEKEAISAVNEYLKKYENKIQDAIDGHINKYGISPRYTDEKPIKLKPEPTPAEQVSDGHGNLTEYKPTEPTIEQKFADVQSGELVTFTYSKESEVPLQLKDKITSRSTVNGKITIRVTLPKSEADYLLSKQPTPTPDLTTATSIQDLQARFKDKAGTPEYNKRMEELRKKSFKEKADELAHRISKAADDLDDITMMAILPYQKQILQAAIKAVAGSVKAVGNIGDAIIKGIEKIRELSKEQKLSDEETDKLVKKFQSLAMWKDFDSPKVQRDIEETVGMRNKLKAEYRNLKDKLFQAEKGLKNKTKTESYEKGAESRNKEVTELNKQAELQQKAYQKEQLKQSKAHGKELDKLQKQSGSYRAELETIEDVKSQIKQSITDNKDVIHKLTGQKTKTLLNRVNNARSYRGLEKVLDYIEKVTTDIQFKEVADDISRSQRKIKDLVKQNEFTKGVLKGYRTWAVELASIPKDKLADIPDEMLSRLHEITTDLTRKKVSDVRYVEKFFNDFRNEMDKVFEPEIEDVLNVDTLDNLAKSVDKIFKVNPKTLNNYDDIIQFKRNLSLVNGKLERLMAQHGVEFIDGKFVDKDGNELTNLSGFTKNYEDALKNLFKSVQEKGGMEGITEDVINKIENEVKAQWKQQAKDNWQNVDWDNFTPEQKEVLTWLKKNANDNVIDELSLGELDTYNKVMEQLTYGNMPRKTIDIASTVDVAKRAQVVDADFINTLRAAAEKSAYVRKRLYGIENKGDLLKDAAWKKDMTDIDEKYGLASKHQHPVFEIFNNALLEPIEFLNVDRDKLFHIALKHSPFSESMTPKFKTKKGKELADREVNALRVLLTWQANIPEAKIEKIMQQTKLSREEVLNYWEIQNSEWGKRYIQDARHSKGYDARQLELDQKAYNNLKKRNGGKLIALDLTKSDEQILNGLKHLLSKEQFQYFKDLYDGYESQKTFQKVNAVKQNISFNELRFYDPFFIFDKPVDDFGNATDFISNVMIDRTAPHTKSGNVNERTFDFHISRMGAEEKFKQYTLTNLLNYHLADPLYNTVRALRKLVNAGEPESKYLTADEVQIVSELSEGLKTRFTNVYATKINRSMGMQIVNNELQKVASYSAKLGRIALLDFTRLTKDAPSNQLTALGQLPVKQWGDYLNMMFKLNKGENDLLQLLHEETGFREAERYYSEYQDSNTLTKQGLKWLSINDRATQRRIFLNEFEHAFLSFTGKEFDMERWKNDMDYNAANADAFKKASAEAKWMAYDTFPSMEKIVKRAQKDPGGFMDIMLNFMQTWSIRESLRFGKQAKNFVLNTNEGRAEAAKKIGAFLSSQMTFATLGVIQSAFITWVAANAVGLWDDNTKKELLATSGKTLSQLKSPKFWMAQGMNGLFQLGLGRYGNWNRIGQVSTLSALNAPYQKKDKPEWLKDVNTYAQAAFYAKPIEIQGYGKNSDQVDAFLQLTMAMEPILRLSLKTGETSYDLAKKVMTGKSLNTNEQMTWNLAKSFHLVLASKYGYPGSGLVDKLFNRINNAENQTKKKKRPGITIINQ